MYNISLYSFESIDDICFIAQCTEKRRHKIRSRHQSFWSRNYRTKKSATARFLEYFFVQRLWWKPARHFSCSCSKVHPSTRHANFFFVSQPSRSPARCTTKAGLPELFYDTESDCIMDNSPLIVFKGRDKTSNVYGSWWVCMNRILE